MKQFILGTVCCILGISSGSAADQALSKPQFGVGIGPGVEHSKAEEAVRYGLESHPFGLVLPVQAVDSKEEVLVSQPHTEVVKIKRQPLQAVPLSAKTISGMNRHSTYFQDKSGLQGLSLDVLNSTEEAEDFAPATASQQESGASLKQRIASVLKRSVHGFEFIDAHYYRIVTRERQRNYAYRLSSEMLALMGDGSGLYRYRIVQDKAGKLFGFPANVQHGTGGEMVEVFAVMDASQLDQALLHQAVRQKADKPRQLKDLLQAF